MEKVHYESCLGYIYVSRLELHIPDEKFVGLYGDIHFPIEPFYALLEMGATYVEMNHDESYHSWMNPLGGVKEE